MDRGSSVSDYSTRGALYPTKGPYNLLTDPFGLPLFNNAAERQAAFRERVAQHLPHRSALLDRINEELRRDYGRRARTDRGPRGDLSSQGSAMGPDEVMADWGEVNSGVRNQGAADANLGQGGSPRPMEEIQWQGAGNGNQEQGVDGGAWGANFGQGAGNGNQEQGADGDAWGDNFPQGGNNGGALEGNQGQGGDGMDAWDGVGGQQGGEGGAWDDNEGQLNGGGMLGGHEQQGANNEGPLNVGEMWDGDEQQGDDGEEARTPSEGDELDARIVEILQSAQDTLRRLRDVLAEGPMLAEDSSESSDGGSAEVSSSRRATDGQWVESPTSSDISTGASNLRAVPVRARRGRGGSPGDSSPSESGGSSSFGRGSANEDPSETAMEIVASRRFQAELDKLCIAFVGEPFRPGELKPWRGDLIITNPSRRVFIPNADTYGFMTTYLGHQAGSYQCLRTDLLLRTGSFEVRVPDNYVPGAPDEYRYVAFGNLELYAYNYARDGSFTFLGKQCLLPRVRIAPQHEESPGMQMHPGHGVPASRLEPKDLKPRRGDVIIKREAWLPDYDHTENKSYSMVKWHTGMKFPFAPGDMLVRRLVGAHVDNAQGTVRADVPRQWGWALLYGFLGTREGWEFWGRTLQRAETPPPPFSRYRVVFAYDNGQPEDVDEYKLDQNPRPGQQVEEEEEA